MGRNGGGIRHGAAVKIVNAKFVVVADTFRESTAQFSISRHQIRFYTQTQMAMCSPRLTLGSADGSTQRKRNEGEINPHVRSAWYKSQRRSWDRQFEGTDCRVHLAMRLLIGTGPISENTTAKS